MKVYFNHHSNQLIYRKNASEYQETTTNHGQKHYFPGNFPGSTPPSHHDFTLQLGELALPLPPPALGVSGEPRREHAALPGDAHALRELGGAEPWRLWAYWLLAGWERG